MPYTARKLITDAYYLTNIVSREFQIVSGEQIGVGASLLNDFLASTALANKRIPFFELYNLALSPGVEKYFVDNLAYIETMTFFDGSVRYPVKMEGMKAHFGTLRVETVQTFPLTAGIKRDKGGMEIYFYPIPDKIYTLQVLGQFILNILANVDIDLEGYYDRSYLTYIKYNLAKLISDDAGTEIPAFIDLEIAKMDKQLEMMNLPDMRKKIRSGIGANLPASIFAISTCGGWGPT